MTVLQHPLVYFKVMNKMIRHIALCLFAATILSACSDDRQADEVKYGKQIVFSVDDLASISRGMGDCQSSCAITDTFRLVDECMPEHSLLCLAEVSDYSDTDIRNSRATIIENANKELITDMGVMAYAHWEASLFMNNEKFVRNAGGVYETSLAAVKYWPGKAENKIDFYTYSPYNAVGLQMPTDYSSKQLRYTVPTNYDEQVDLMLDSRNDVPGDYNSDLPMTLHHLLACVRVVIPSIPERATVESITLSNVINKGTLDMGVKPYAWNLGDTRESFSTTLTKNSVGEYEAVFMMLPQLLANEVAISMKVHDDKLGECNMTKILPTKEWVMGMKTTYRLYFNYYEFKLEEVHDNTVDAHYTVFKTNLNVSHVPSDVEWTLNAYIEGASSTDEAVTIMSEEDLNRIEDGNVAKYVNEGYWLNRIINKDDNQDLGSARGESSFIGHGSVQGKPIYIFIPENMSGKDRNIKFSIDVNGAKRAVDDDYMILQKSPISIAGQKYVFEAIEGDVGTERLANDMYIWGFYSNRKIYYTYRPEGSFLSFLDRLIAYLSIQNTHLEYATIDYKPGQSLGVQFDYSVLSDFGNKAGSLDVGLNNTLDIYNFVGSEDYSAFEKRIIGYNGVFGGKYQAGTPEGDDLANDNAAVTIAFKKNKFNLMRTEITEQGRKQIIYGPFIEANDVKWYLPARNQYSSPEISPLLNGEYWTSTVSGKNGQEQYCSYSTVGEKPRSERYKVRAARIKP